METSFVLALRAAGATLTRPGRMPDVAARRTAPVADGASLPGMSAVFVIEAADLDGEAVGSSEDVPDCGCNLA